MAPSTLGTFLRAFTFGHVRQLDRVLAEALERAWGGRRPGDGRLVDRRRLASSARSTARPKQGAGFGYTRRRGYHPLLATRADTGEVLHVRLRKGSANTSRGMLRFADELIARVARAGATGPKLLRADSGFWNKQAFARLDRAGWQFSIGVRCNPTVRAAIEQIAETPGDPRRLPRQPAIAQIAETTSAAPADRPPRPHARAPGRAARLLAALRVHRPTAPSDCATSRPSTASTPSSSSPSATSKTKRSRTSPPGTSPPTPPGR